MKVTNLKLKKMNLNKYQNISKQTRIYPENMKIVYPCLGLSGEVGEVCDKIKKVYRDKQGIFTEELKLEIAKEIGDVLWYISALSTDLNLNLDDILTININKILERKENNMLNGEGDNR